MEEPHEGQKRDDSGTEAEQEGQLFMARKYTESTPMSEGLAAPAPIERGAPTRGSGLQPR